MSEQVTHQTAHQSPGTGHPVVDEVLASLADLEDRPAGEHVAVFEAAHDRLRGALSEAGDQDPGTVPDAVPETGTGHGVEGDAPAVG